MHPFSMAKAVLALALVVPGVVNATPVSTPPPVQPDQKITDRTGTGRRPLAATIRYTEYGIPHITADDLAGAGFGQGYAQARDNTCVLADAYLTVRGERSRHLGPDAAPTGQLSGATTNLSSDAFFRAFVSDDTLRRLLARPAPYGPRPEVRELVRGFVAGYNKHLAEGRVTDPACRGASWVRPITEIDAYRLAYAFSLALGHAGFSETLTSAEPPPGAAVAKPAGPGKASGRPRGRKAVTALASPARATGLGSNAVALGGAATVNGRGMLLGNPHYPWHGGRRMWQSQLSVPGVFNVSGATILGFPVVALGHTATVAWSHTVSAATGTFGLFELKLKPGDPTTYFVEGRPERMTRRVVAVDVKEPGGRVSRVERTFWSTRYGPVTTLLPWTAGTAYAMRDANADNLRTFNTWFAFDRARTTGDLLTALRTTQGLPWVNTVAADSRGRTLFAGIQPLANVPDDLARRCGTEAGRRLFAENGVPVLDGSRRECVWGDDPTALSPGTFGPNRLPVLRRDDYVANSNNPHWMTNPAQPLEGFPRVVGQERHEQGARARMGAVAIGERLRRGRFRIGDLQELLTSNRVHAAELALRDTVRMCRALPGGRAPAAEGPVDVREACRVLARWDGRADVTSRGALLFARYWLRVPDRDLWKVPFDPSDPVRTPRVLNVGNAGVRRALGDAVAELRRARIPLDAPYGEHHHVTRNGERIPLPGAGGRDNIGVYNFMEMAWDPVRGENEVVSGSSYVQAVAFDGTSCPDARTLVTYSQSADPTSPHFSDQTRLFSEKRWVRSRFCEPDVLAAPSLKTLRITG
ncbi:penicillin acylase family protein [Streptosporangium sp. NPDC001559]|uniref:penicillin acylase family protein n=1 Tax=Streptosporangium sp. NPDC001559 TaxID=3366187 RepID=UPI0036EC05DD